MEARVESDDLSVGSRSKGKRDKKDKGYAHLDGASSEEEGLVDEGFVGGGGESARAKGGGAKLFGKKATKEKRRDGKEKSAHSASKRKDKAARVSQAPVESAALRPIFGRPLSEAVGVSRSHDGLPLPAVVRRCIDYVDEHGLQCEGVYRRSPPKPALERLRALADEQRPLDFADAHHAAALLKLFLRELPEHVLSAELRPSFEKAAAECHCADSCCCLRGDQIRALLQLLPPCNYALLAYVFKHACQVVNHESANKMSFANLGVVLQVTLNMSQRLLSIFFFNTRSASTGGTCLFDDVEYKRYVGPIRPRLERLAVELPTERRSIETELQKQQSLLGELHEEITALRTLNVNVQSKEQELWEVQLVATQLKRRLKALTNNVGGKDDKRNEPDRTAGTRVELPAGPSVEMYEEKQLLAVQMDLKEQISIEKASIDELQKKIADRISELQISPSDDVLFLLLLDTESSCSLRTMTERCRLTDEQLNRHIDETFDAAERLLRGLHASATGGALSQRQGSSRPLAVEQLSGRDEDAVDAAIFYREERSTARPGYRFRFLHDCRISEPPTYNTVGDQLFDKATVTTTRADDARPLSPLSPRVSPSHDKAVTAALPCRTLESTPTDKLALAISPDTTTAVSPKPAVAISPKARPPVGYLDSETADDKPPPRTADTASEPRDEPTCPVPLTCQSNEGLSLRGLMMHDMYTTTLSRMDVSPGTLRHVSVQAVVSDYAFNKPRATLGADKQTALTEIAASTKGRQSEHTSGLAAAAADVEYENKRRCTLNVAAESTASTADSEKSARRRYTLPATEMRRDDPLAIGKGRQAVGADQTRKAETAHAGGGCFGCCACRCGAVVELVVKQTAANDCGANVQASGRCCCCCAHTACSEPPVGHAVAHDCARTSGRAAHHGYGGACYSYAQPACCAHLTCCAHPVHN